ncbi:hypothetical protein FKM82_017430 [Ascaphus truei]
MKRSANYPIQSGIKPVNQTTWGKQASVIENPKHFPVISIERKCSECIKKVSQTTIPIQAPFNQKHQLSNLQHQLSNLQLPINVPSRVDNFTPSFCQQPLQELEVSIPIPPEQREERGGYEKESTTGEGGVSLSTYLQWEATVLCSEAGGS